ncbi:MAG: cupin domain-containing protein [Pseudomonadota bacterium]
MNKTVIFANDKGTMETFPNAPDFWQDTLRHLPEGYLISQYTFTQSWPTWERHPQGHEFVTILSGRITLIFQNDDGDEHRTLSEGQFIIIPEGQWHTADLTEPVTGLFVTFGKGTENKPR